MIIIEILVKCRANLITLKKHVENGKYVELPLIPGILYPSIFSPIALSIFMPKRKTRFDGYRRNMPGFIIITLLNAITFPNIYRFMMNSIFSHIVSNDSEVYQ